MPAREEAGISTRLMLVGALLLVIGSVMLGSFLVIRARMRQQVQSAISSDLWTSVEAFRQFDSQHFAALKRENALLADLPSLKALMTTSDERTIEDGAVEFWKTSGDDLFALVLTDGRVVAAKTRQGPNSDRVLGADLKASVETLMPRTQSHFLLSGGRIFVVSVSPIYFGSQVSGTLLGYVISGYAVDQRFLDQVSRVSAAESAFISRDREVTSTLRPFPGADLRDNIAQIRAASLVPATISLRGQRFLVTSIDLSDQASAPLLLVVMKSFAQAEQAQREINRLLALVGFSALGAGTLLMLTVARFVTRPLEMLAAGVRAFGKGNEEADLPRKGPREVRELSLAFASMRGQIAQKSRALLEAERLATIGRMANSVSHDLRHYLAAVYANAEFLSSSNLNEEERAELFSEIRMAVHGTTELIDSLLIFSRTNGAPQRTPELVSALLERAIMLVRSHPDAAGVRLEAGLCNTASTAAHVDSKQVERALYNLLLNACQAARASRSEPFVAVSVEPSEKTVCVRITDNGPGVSEDIRDSLFDPFVSVGKQNGTGLGLTLAAVVARDHGGSVDLELSCTGKTVFLFSVVRGPKIVPAANLRVVS